MGIALKSRDECILAVQSGRADCVILAVNLGLTAVKKNPELGAFQMLHKPEVKLPTCMGIRMEPDKRWQNFLNAWVDFNRGTQQIREWLYAGLAINGVKPEDIEDLIDDTACRTLDLFGYDVPGAKRWGEDGTGAAEL